MSDRVDDKRYFVFQDRSEVCFVTNVCPEHMDSQVARLQPEGVLRNQSVPPSSSFGCGVCKVRLCKTTCSAEVHHH